MKIHLLTESYLNPVLTTVMDGAGPPARGRGLRRPHASRRATAAEPGLQEPPDVVLLKSRSAEARRVARDGGARRQPGREPPGGDRGGAGPRRHGRGPGAGGRPGAPQLVGDRHARTWPTDERSCPGPWSSRAAPAPAATSCAW